MPYVVRAVLALLGCTLLLGPGTVDARDSLDTTATYYHPSLHGLPMANGERYDRGNPLIAACNWFPLGTLLKVTRPNTQDFIYVRVQDRGANALTLDLSEAGFTRLGGLGEGRIPVRLEIVRATDDVDIGRAEGVRTSRLQAGADAAQRYTQSMQALGLADGALAAPWRLDEALLRRGPWLGQPARPNPMP
jgi:rare lipoprotein A (peptidoglycan hydrolase)